MSTARLPSRIVLVLSEAAGEEPVLRVMTAVGSERLQWRNIETRSKKLFRALCILVLLAKDREERASEKDVLSFDSKTDSSTWIKALASQRKSSKRNLLEDLGLRSFWKGLRGGKKVFPHVEFYTERLPLKNVTIRTAASTVPIDGLRLRELATSLEAELVIAHLPSKERWEVAIVPHLLRETDEWSSNMPPADYDVATVPFLLSKRPSFEETKRELFYHLRRHAGENAALVLLENYEHLWNVQLSPVSGDFALLTAISFGKNTIVDWMLNNPAVDTNKANKKGITATHKAARMNNYTLAEKLFSKHANPAQDTYQKRNALHEAAFGATLDCLETFKHFTGLIGSKSYAEDITGITPLSLAIYRKCPEPAIRCLKECLKELGKLERSMRYMTGDLSGRLRETRWGIHQFENINTPMSAQEYGWDRGRSRRCGVLFESVMRDNLENAKNLLANERPSECLPFDANDEYIDTGRTTLHEAVEFCRPEMVELLLQYGADPFREDIHGRIPREFLPHVKTERERTIESALWRWEQEWIKNEYERKGGSRRRSRHL